MTLVETALADLIAIDLDPGRNQRGGGAVSDRETLPVKYRVSGIGFEFATG
jgi:hypothetical protein